jgi:hypothetical protein
MRSENNAKAMVAGITTMVDKTKTMVGDPLPLAKRQKLWRDHETVGEETKPIGEAFPDMVGDDSYLIE